MTSPLKLSAWTLPGIWPSPSCHCDQSSSAEERIASADAGIWSMTSSTRGRSVAQRLFTCAEKAGSSSIRVSQCRPVRVNQPWGVVVPCHLVPALRSKSHTGPMAKRPPGVQVRLTLVWKLESWLRKNSSTRYQSTKEPTSTRGRYPVRRFAKCPLNSAVSRRRAAALTS